MTEEMLLRWRAGKTGVPLRQALVHIPLATVAAMLWQALLGLRPLERAVLRCQHADPPLMFPPSH